MSYKLIVFDIDGTIREPGFEISNQLKKTVKLLKNMGNFKIGNYGKIIENYFIGVFLSQVALEEEQVVEENRV